VGKLVGHARASSRRQGADRMGEELFAVGVRLDELHVAPGVSEACASGPTCVDALTALEDGDIRTISTLDPTSGATAGDGPRAKLAW
jgi:hypothetical protein